MASHHQRHSSALPYALTSASSSSSNTGTIPNGRIIPGSAPPSPSVAIRRSSLPAGILPASPAASPPSSPALRASPLSAAITAANGMTTTGGGIPRSPSASSVSHHNRAHSNVLGPLASSAFVWPSAPVHVMGNSTNTNNGTMGSPPATPSRLTVNTLSPSTVVAPMTMRVSQQIPTYDDPMRIAFIGPRDSGKTTFIKSFASGSWTHDCPSLPSLLTAKAADTVELKCAFWRTGDGRPGMGSNAGSGNGYTGGSMPSTPSSLGMSTSLWDASSRNGARSERLCEVSLIDPARNFRSEADEATWAAAAEGIVFMIHWRQLGQVPTVYFQDYRGQIAVARHEAAMLKSGKKPKSKPKPGNTSSSSSGRVMNGDGAHDVSDAAGDGSTIPCVIVVTKCDQFLSPDLWAESDAGWLAVLRPSSVERFRALIADTTSLTRDIGDTIMMYLHIAAVPPETTAKLAEARQMAAQIDAGFFITSSKSRMMVFSAISDLATRIEGRRRQARLHGHSHTNGTAGGGMVTNDNADSKKCSVQ